MASLKTSQETSGSTASKNDLYRIARSGSNYKLTSEQLFSETITISQLDTLINGSNLITGRNYKVTNCGSSANLTLLLTATSNNQVSENATLIYGSDQNFICHYNLIADNVDWLIDNVGNMIYNPFGLGANFPIGIGANNIIYTTGSTFEVGLTLNNCYVKNTIFTGMTSASSITNCTFENCNIVGDGSALALYNCNFKNCTIEITSSATLQFINVIGDKYINPVYVFDTNISGGTIVTGQFSTIEKVIDANVHYDGTNTITIPAYNSYIGKYLLQNFALNSNVEFIINIEQSHTPITFQNDSGTSINIVHVNTFSSILGYDIFFPDHHGGGGGGTTSALETNYSNISGKFDSNNLVFVTKYYQNYPA